MKLFNSVEKWAQAHLKKVIYKEIIYLIYV